SALRPFQHLDALQVVIHARTAALGAEHRILRQRNLGEIADDAGAGAERRALAPDEEDLALASLPHRADDKRRHLALKILAGGDVLTAQLAIVDRGDRDRHALRGLGT